MNLFRGSKIFIKIVVNWSQIMIKAYTIEKDWKVFGGYFFQDQLTPLSSLFEKREEGVLKIKTEKISLIEDKSFRFVWKNYKWSTIVSPLFFQSYSLYTFIKLINSFWLHANVI